VHDLLHDLALYVAKEEFVMVVSHTRNISEQARHLSIVENDSLGHVLFPKSKSVRTIQFPMYGVGLENETLLDTWILRYKYLRYLGLSHYSLETLPNSIGKLEHLRVLIIDNNIKIRRLPRSIFKLLNLQTQQTLPRGILVNGCMNLETLPRGIE
jgi:Leucine-rich repeat (LRR) protein